MLLDLIWIIFFILILPLLLIEIIYYCENHRLLQALDEVFRPILKEL